MINNYEIRLPGGVTVDLMIRRPDDLTAAQLRSLSAQIDGIQIMLLEEANHLPEEPDMVEAPTEDAPPSEPVALTIATSEVTGG